MSIRTWRAFLWAQLFLLLLAVPFACAAQISEKDSYAQGMREALAGRFTEAKKAFISGLNTDHPFYSPLTTSISIIEDLDNRLIKRKTALCVFKGVAYGNQGNHQEAIAEFTKAIASDPGYALAYNSRGSLSMP